MLAINYLFNYYRYYGHRTNDKYDSHRHYKTVSDDIFNMSHYNEPSARTIGNILKKIF